jgi:hypothetical protein
VLDLGEEGRLVEGKGGDTFIVGGSFINLITLPNVSLTTLLEESLLKFLLLLFCLLFHFIIFIIWIICNEMSTLTTIIAISFTPWLVVLSVVLLGPQDLLEALDEERHFLFIKLTLASFLLGASSFSLVAFKEIACGLMEVLRWSMSSMCLESFTII